MNPVDPDGYEQRPLLNKNVRDVASRGEGGLVAVRQRLAVLAYIICATVAVVALAVAGTPDG
ncbi:hypothetical protein FKN01_21270 [Streptomyces sp. 130]|uniref:hypothetical protein n=1 Tax=Streptomyces sp. 130 TaxID=2591006 RepID=UPI0011808C9E|nr:hypothetical protein [Streptomyces sp. 130]TRV75612.1 hypothetical protein FKN01_21270 [Streptomyces sp. 130]